ERRRLLDARQGGDLGGFEALARDGEVLDGALCLGAVEGGGGHADLAHCVVLDTVVSLCAHGAVIAFCFGCAVGGMRGTVAPGAQIWPMAMSSSTRPSSRR